MLVIIDVVVIVGNIVGTDIIGLADAASDARLSPGAGAAWGAPGATGKPSMAGELI